MPPKFEADADGDIPPCGIMWDINALENWEESKNKKHGDKRKAPCKCKMFEGKLPSSHTCTIINKPNKPSKNIGCFSWFKTLFYRK